MGTEFSGHFHTGRCLHGANRHPTTELPGCDVDAGVFPRWARSARVIKIVRLVNSIITSGGRVKLAVLLKVLSWAPTCTVSIDPSWLW